MKSSKLTLALTLTAFGCAQGQEQAPGLSNVSADQSLSEALAPSEELQEESGAAAEEEGLFLAAAKATIPASGGGQWKNTSQGYQYYNASGKPTSWFGKPGADGTWAMTQGNYNGKSYDFEGQNTLVMNKKSDGWVGGWQQYDREANKYQPVFGQENGGYVHRVTYSGTGSNMQYQNGIINDSAKSGVLWNGATPQSQASVVQNGKIGESVATPEGLFGNVQSFTKNGTSKNANGNYFQQVDSNAMNTGFEAFNPSVMNKLMSGVH